MINCPKCGFEQPQDDFCAKCGVNMAKFRPPTKPLFTVITESLFFRAAALTLVIGFALLILKAKFFDREDSATLAITEDAGEKSAPDIKLPVLRESRIKSAATDKPAALAGAAATAAPAAKAKQAPISENFTAQIIFLEVPRAEYEANIAPHEKFIGNQVRGGQMPTVPETLLKNSRILGRENKMMAKGEFLEILRGSTKVTTPESQQYGISLQIQYNDIIDNQRAIQFSYLAHFPLFEQRKLASVETSELTDSIKLPDPGALFISGSLPRKTGIEEYPLSGGIYQILASPRYRESESEFVILVTTKH